MLSCFTCLVSIIRMNAGAPLFTNTRRLQGSSPKQEGNTLDQDKQLEPGFSRYSEGISPWLGCREVRSFKLTPVTLEIYCFQLCDFELILNKFKTRVALMLIYFMWLKLLWRSCYPDREQDNLQDKSIVVINLLVKNRCMFPDHIFCMIWSF